MYGLFHFDNNQMTPLFRLPAFVAAHTIKKALSCGEERIFYGQTAFDA